ncbi:Fatty acid cis/trans isomerase (CTI), partial [Candidatus Electrothrix marina]
VGINRADPRFWQEYDWFQQRFFQEQPVEAGFFDLNRYYPPARIRQ